MRNDHRHITSLITPRTKVLEIGCGSGELLSHLTHNRGCSASGIEIMTDNVQQCLAKGLSVMQGNAGEHLSHYGDDSFDYVVLSHTIQALENPRSIIEQVVRIGKKAIISFPNFGYYKVRLDLLFNGMMPVNKYLKDQWYDTTNIHLCTYKDFIMLCKELEIMIVATYFNTHLPQTINKMLCPNLLAQQVTVVCSS